jgi:uncharacterized protein (DUF302 family)
MSPTSIPYGFVSELALPFSDALDCTRTALGDEGFGVLCEIDVAATLKQRLGVEMPRYTILGACNPPLAHRALRADPNVGLLLPCNVVVREGDLPGTTVVGVIDPEKQIRGAEGGELGAVAGEAAQRLWRVLIAVGAKGHHLEPVSRAAEAVDVAEEIC